VAVYYFDSSALAKLYHEERGSRRVRDLADKSGNRLLISRLTVVEMYSVVALKARSHAISSEEASDARIRFLADISAAAIDVLALSPSHYDGAERLIGAYGASQGLRTLDALQLSVAVGLPPGTVDYVVSSDRRFCAVAQAEKLAVINPETD
jgi:uncharacterized protein